MRTPQHRLDEVSLTFGPLTFSPLTFGPLTFGPLTFRCMAILYIVGLCHKWSTSDVKLVPLFPDGPDIDVYTGPPMTLPRLEPTTPKSTTPEFIAIQFLESGLTDRESKCTTSHLTTSLQTTSRL